MSAGEFKSEQARRLVEYVHEKYARQPEHLWARSPDNAIWRRGDNEKWFGAILTVKRNKIIPGDDERFVEILDVRCVPDITEFIVDGNMIFPGWHMNKRHWITVILDGRMSLRKIKALVDNSFDLAGKK
ncbi:MAG: MmcQ/YjbR family DNA-binding protein [Alphaproteobacteria bacterium]|nr:MmcQ/YjbR family DNA-binding protein [Alphaproteobacteria bacterium]